MLSAWLSLFSIYRFLNLDVHLHSTGMLPALQSRPSSCFRDRDCCGDGCRTGNESSGNEWHRDASGISRDFQHSCNETHSGFLLMLRMAALLVLALLMAGVKRTRDAHLFKYLMPVPGVILAWTFSASGHPSVRGYLPAADRGSDSSGRSKLVGRRLFVLALIILPPLVRSGNMMMIADVSRMFTRVTGACSCRCAADCLVQYKDICGQLRSSLEHDLRAYHVSENTFCCIFSFWSEHLIVMSLYRCCSTWPARGLKVRGSWAGSSALSLSVFVIIWAGRSRFFSGKRC